MKVSNSALWENKKIYAKTISKILLFALISQSTPIIGPSSMPYSDTRHGADG